MPKKAQIKPDDKAGLISELDETINRYGRLERMAEELRRFPQFSDLTRSTISRWRTQPAKRTRAALSILNARRSVVLEALLIAIIDSTLALAPLDMLWTASNEPGSFEQRFGMVLRNTSCENGSRSREHLLNGTVDFAVFSPQLRQSEESLVRLCNLSRAPLVGISDRPIGSISDLQGMTVVIPENTGVGIVLERLRESNAWVGFDIKPLKNVEMASFLTSATNCAVVAWEPLLSQVESEVPKKIERIERGLLPKLELDLWTNANSISPAAVRNLLTALSDTSRQIERNKRNPRLIKRISEKLGMEQKHVRTALETTEFSWNGSDLERMRPLLEIWEREFIQREIKSES